MGIIIIIMFKMVLVTIPVIIPALAPAGQILVPHNKGLFFFPTTKGPPIWTLLGPKMAQSLLGSF